eukprot:4331815-Prymnesium_polylepis.1
MYVPWPWYLFFSNSSCVARSLHTSPCASERIGRGARRPRHRRGGWARGPADRPPRIWRSLHSGTSPCHASRLPTTRP